MADKLTWQFELQDKFSGSAKNIDRALGGVQQGLRKIDPMSSKATSGVQKLDRAMGHASTSAFSFSSAMESLGAAAGVVTAAAAAAGGLAAIGGKFALDTLRFKEDTMAGFKAMLGSKEEANRVFQTATKFAAVTPFKTSEVIGMANSLLTRGFKTDEIENLMKGVGDVGAMLGNQKMESVINALGKMRSTGKLTGDSLQMLADAGVNTKLVMASLATQLGKSEEQVRSLLSAGKISDAQGIAAAMEAISKGISGGKLGGAMEEKSATLSGLLSTLESAPEEIIFGLSDKLAVMIDPIKSLIKKGIALFGPEAPGGRLIGEVFVKLGDIIGRVAGTISSVDFGKWLGKIEIIGGKAWRMLEKLFSGFSKVFGLSDAGGSLESILDAINERLDSMDPATMEKLGVALGYVVFGVMKLFEWSIRLAIALGEVVDAVMGFWSDVADFSKGVVDGIAEEFGTLPSRMIDIGFQIVQGLLQGITTGGPSITTAVDSLGQSLIDKAKAKLGIKSPSTVFAEIGQFTGLGFLQGLDASGMNQAIANPITPQQVAAAAPAAGASPGGATVSIANLVINVGDGVKDAAMAREHGKAAATSFGEQVTSMLRGVAKELGG